MSYSLQEIQSQIDALSAANKELFEVKKPIDLKISENYSKIKNLKEDYSKTFLSNPELSFNDKFEFLMFENGSSGDPTISAAINLLFKNELPALKVAGYFSFSSQKSISVALIKGINCNLQNVYQDLNKIIDLIKPSNASGDKIFDLFEHTLSKYSSYCLKLSSSNVWSLVEGRSHTNFDSLMDLLIYCQENHYYESSLPADNDEDEDQDDQ
jgi:phage-related protein